MTAAADAPTITVSTPLRRFPPNAEAGTRPAHHLNDSKTKFGNPWPSFRPHTFSQIFSIPYTVATKMPSIPADVKSRIPTRSPTWGAESDPDRQKGKATWLGHACYLLELPAPPNATRGVRIIFDPVFSTRCSPFSFLGPVRYTDPPCKIEDVPEVDAIVISHNHYDHMDIPTLRALLTKRPSSNPHIFVGLNNARCFQRQLDLPNERVHEMDWYDERVLNVNLSPEGENMKVRITSTPSQHMSARGLFDRNASLWSAWAIEELLPPASPSSDPSVGKKLYFAGDTAYRTTPTSSSQDAPICPAFAETGERFGGFDLALIPIGAYAPRHLFSNMHASPGDAVGIFKDLRAKKAAGMHWGTWALTVEDVLEPPKVLREECVREGVGEGEFVVPGLGEMVFL